MSLVPKMQCGLPSMKNLELPSVACSLDARPVLMLKAVAKAPAVIVTFYLGRKKLGRRKGSEGTGNVTMFPCSCFLRDPPAVPTCTSLAKAVLHTQKEVCIGCLYL